MPYADSLILLVSVYMMSLISPGPNFIIVTTTSMSVSRSAGLCAGMGLAMASLTWAVMTMAGLGLLIARFDWLHVALRIIGAVYLIWIGIKMIREAKSPVPLPGTVEVTKAQAMRRAYVVSMTNPKSVAFFFSVFALVMPAAAPLWFYAEVTLICFILSAAWYCGLALVFSNARVAAQFLRFKTRIEQVMGTALILLGGRLLFSR